MLKIVDNGVFWRVVNTFDGVIVGTFINRQQARRCAEELEAEEIQRIKDEYGV